MRRDRDESTAPTTEHDTILRFHSKALERKGHQGIMKATGFLCTGHIIGALDTFGTGNYIEIPRASHWPVFGKKRKARSFSGWDGMGLLGSPGLGTRDLDLGLDLVRSIDEKRSEYPSRYL